MGNRRISNNRFISSCLNVAKEQYTIDNAARVQTNGKMWEKETDLIKI